MVGPALPVDLVLPELADALGTAGAAVLVAPPGTGKTTRVPPALLEAPWLDGRGIVVLEPRRLAARAAARFMASERGEPVGATVGYRVRLDSRVGEATRIEVVTEGVLTRRLQSDPELAGVGLVVLDEFHERSLDADLALALLLDVRGALRPDLRLLVMSATLDPAPVSALLGDAPVIDVPHRPHPVETRFLPHPATGRPEHGMAAAIRQAVRDEAGSVLAFLPGEAEIRCTLAALDGTLPPDVDAVPLYGALGPDEQDAAIRPAPEGRRKVVLATNIAETSLTIDGVRQVIDGGRARRARFDPASGMSRLETVRVSRAEADQRRGRAGRLGPGICWRLWTAEEDRALIPASPPETLTADLAPLALELAAWGIRDPGELAWLDRPPEAPMAQAGDLLRRLGALGDDGAITDVGRAMTGLPLHPRLAHLVIEGQRRGHAATAADLAALLEERDPLRGKAGADLAERLAALRRSGHGGALARVRRVADDLRRRLRVGRDQRTEPGTAGVLTALAFPDRVGQRRGGPGRYRLAAGGGAALPAEDPLANDEFLAVAHMDPRGADGRVFLAARIDRGDIESLFADRIRQTDEVTWDARREEVVARRRRRLDALVLEDAPLPDPAPDAILRAMLDGVRRLGLATLPWTPELRQWQARVTFLRECEPDTDWPDVSDAALAASLDDWLAPFLVGVTDRDGLRTIDLPAALATLLSWDLARRLDEFVPPLLTMPTGSRVPIDYASPGAPLARVRLQEAFGMTETPKVAGGIPVALELLSPARRPLALTSDLASFWANAYPRVRGEMRGRYPKHPWPEDPLGATPTRGIRRRG